MIPDRTMQRLRNWHVLDRDRWVWVGPAVTVGLLFPLLVHDAKENWATSIFYTSSTIAQTLAALFGVLAAFTFFRMPAAEADVTRLVNHAVDKIHEAAQHQPPELRDAMAAGAWESVAEMLRPSNYPSVAALADLYPRISEHIDRVNRLRSGLLDLLLPTVEAIFAALLLLPFANLLSRREFLAVPMLLAVVALALRALVGFVPIARDAMGRTVWAKGVVHLRGHTLSATATVGPVPPVSQPAQ
jgi:hypothetical protein